jgi:hypothetical protein
VIGRGAKAAALVVGLTACGGARKPAEPPETPLHLAPACDLVPAAGAAWVLEASPRAIAAIPDLIPVIAEVVPEERFRMFAAGHGGIDPRQVQDLCVARTPTSTLYVARVPFAPARVETAFADRATRVLARTAIVARPPVVRLDGDVHGESEHLTLFDHEALAWEVGPVRALRASEAFARGALKRSPPVLRSSSLAPVAALLGEGALARWLVPGPFEGETGAGLGGLLRAATAVGVAVRFDGPPAKLGVRVVVAGAWSDPEAARERLAAAVHVLSESRVGRLFGLASPVTSPSVHVAQDALVLEAVVDGAAAARGLHAALEADVREILDTWQAPKLERSP